MNPQHPIPAMQQYFAAERAEVTTILLGCALFLIAALALFFVHRDGFSKGFLLTVVLGVAVFGGASALILKRDPGRLQALAAQVETGNAAQATQLEAERMGTVVSSYQYYRWVVACLAVMAVVLTLVTRVGFWNGVATGIVVLAAAQMAIDYYSEVRAQRYLSVVSSAR